MKTKKEQIEEHKEWILSKIPKNYVDECENYINQILIAQSRIDIEEFCKMLTRHKIVYHPIHIELERVAQEGGFC